MAREQLKVDEPRETSLLNRRSYLKIVSSAAAAVAVGSSSVSAADSTLGYGEGQYGQLPYGESEPVASAPTIERFEITKSEQLGDNRMFSVQWAVSNSDKELDTVEVVTVEDTDSLNFAVTDISGGTASGWDLFQFPVDTELDVSLRAQDAAENATKETQTISL